MDNELLQRTSTELHLRFIPMQSQQLYPSASHTHGLPMATSRATLYVVSGQAEKRVRPWRSAESMHTTLVMTRRDC